MESEGTEERQTDKQTEDRLTDMVQDEQQIPERRVPGFQRSNSRLMDISIKKNSLQNQLSIISEKSDQDFLLGEEDSDPFDVDEIIRHLSSFSSDEQEIVTELNVVDVCKKSIESESKKKEPGRNFSHSNSGEWRRISDTSGIR